MSNDIYLIQVNKGDTINFPKNIFGISGLGRSTTKDEDIWILFEPQNYKAAGIRVSLWVESLKPPPVEEETGGNQEEAR